MYDLLSSRWSPIGVALDTRAIHAVQLRRRKGAWEIAATAALTRPDATPEIRADDANRLRDTLVRQGFHGTEIVLAAPRQLLGHAEFAVERGADPDRVTDRAAREVADVLRCERDELQVAWWPPQRSDGSRGDHSIRAVGCRTTDAETLLAPFDAAGLTVIGLETSSMALARWSQFIAEGVPSCVALLDIGWDATQLTLVDEGAVVFERQLPAGGVQVIHDAIESQWNMASDEVDVLLSDGGLDHEAAEAGLRESIDAVILERLADLRHEVEHSLRYVNSHYRSTPIDRLVLVGEGAGLHGLDRRLSVLLDLPVECPTLTSSARCAGALGQTTRLAVAAGLAGTASKGGA